MGSPPQPQAWEELQNRCLRDFCKIRHQKWRRTPQNFPHFRPFLPKKAAIEKPPTPKEQSWKIHPKDEVQFIISAFWKNAGNVNLKRLYSFSSEGKANSSYMNLFEISLFFNDNRPERSVFVWAHTFKAFGYLSKKNYETYWFAFDRSEIRQIFISNGQGNA